MPGGCSGRVWGSGCEQQACCLHRRKGRPKLPSDSTEGELLGCGSGSHRCRYGGPSGMVQYLVDLDPELVYQPWLMIALCFSRTKPEAQVSFLEFLEHQWSTGGEEMVAADRRGNRYCLDLYRIWDRTMHYSIAGGSLERMQLLYDAGYEQHRSREASHHPGVYVLACGTWLLRHMARACWLLAIS
eukprot:jgi/Botrbrau1/12670/Bobra.67_1s0034.1